MPETKAYTRAVEIVRTLTSHGHQALFAGGCVRDHLLGTTPADFDIATSATPDQVMSIFKNVIPVGKQFGVVIVVLGSCHFEVATFREEGGYQDGRRPDTVTFSNAKNDALRRDFSVNGMFFDPLTGQVLDFVGGQKDLEAKVIKTIGSPEQRFEEDYLRMIRAVRFTARLGFKMQSDTFDEITRKSSLIKQVSVERIYDELTKMMVGPNPDIALELLYSTGLLPHILPEVQAMYGVEQPPEFHPEGDVFEHTKMMLGMLEQPNDVLAFSVLFHDVGKPPTFYRASDRIRFNGHELKGAHITEGICRRLKFPNEKRKKIVHCVGNHMRFMHVQQMRLAKLKRLMAADTFEEELELHRLDCLASHGMIDNWEFLKEKQEEFGHEQIKPEPLLNGKDLIRLGFKPGPIFAKILTALETRQLENEITTKDQATEFVKNSFSP